ncbi:hypothetical protein [Rothia nasisuis]|uniref:hypothetical protein n=1 Tax=Rothia nasisuis TaxID=2109647 RepID=UPI001F35792D|nr:hypothetical protein [Rothia nasisuis]
MGKTLTRTLWCLLLAGALTWLAILLWPGHQATAWLTTRLIIAQAVAFPTLLHGSLASYAGPAHSWGRTLPGPLTRLRAPGRQVEC